MSIKILQPKSANEVIEVLEKLAFQENDVIFRGHELETYRLASTLSRYSSTAHEDWNSWIDEMLSHFHTNLASIKRLPPENMNRRGRLEYGRHHGVPSPLIDFTHSPYVALFFAFNKRRPDPNRTDERVVVNALRLGNLATAWAMFRNGTFDHSNYDGQRSDRFRWHRIDIFEHGYPGECLQYFHSAASWNVRMQRQMGAFIYDTLDYRELGMTDLEDFIDKFPEPTGPDGTRNETLVRVLIPLSDVGPVFSRLELMGITGARIMDDGDGAADDVFNAYSYNRKLGDAWDLVMPPPDDTKM